MKTNFSISTFENVTSRNQLGNSLIFNRLVMRSTNRYPEASITALQWVKLLQHAFFLQCALKATCFEKCSFVRCYHDIEDGSSVEGPAPDEIEESFLGLGGCHAAEYLMVLHDGLVGDVGHESGRQAVTRDHSVVHDVLLQISRFHLSLQSSQHSLNHIYIRCTHTYLHERAQQAISSHLGITMFT